MNDPNTFPDGLTMDALASLPVPVLSAGVEGDIAWMNDAARATFSVNDGPYESLLVSDLLETTEAAIDSLLKGAENGERDEWETVAVKSRRNSTLTTLAVSRRAFRDVHGSPRVLLLIPGGEERSTALDWSRSSALISRLTAFFHRTGNFPADVEGYLDSICDTLWDMYRPLILYIHTTYDDRIRHRAASGIRLESDSRGRPKALPLSMCRRVREEGSPFLSNRLQEDEYRTDKSVRAFGLRTYLGAPLRDSSGVVRGTLALVDRETRPVESLDIELVTVASLQVAARLRAEEQERARKELEDHLRHAQKMEALGMLAGGIAHDFNNILSGILGYSSHLLTKVEESSTLHRDLKLIETSAERAADLTRQLLSFARHKNFPKRPMSINEVVEEALGILRRTVDKNIEVVTEFSADLPAVLGDAGQLNQVVMNLCLNAADAMAEKGGTLTVLTKSGPLNNRETRLIRHGTESEESFVRIVVRDTGVGIRADVRSQIFDPFFTTKEKGGSGLGLSIVYGIVSNHGGDILVESWQGRGSTFTVYLPEHSGAVPIVEEQPRGDLSGTETVFVVEDELIVRQMVVEILRGSGYKVLAAASGDSAVSLFKRMAGNVDLVLLDLVMPGMSGEETFEHLRGLKPDLPILLTSGFAEAEVRERLMAAGACGLVHKPYKSDALLIEIRRVLGERDTGQGRA